MVKKIFSVSLVVLVSIPLLSEFGLHERFTSLVGVERKVAVPALSSQTWISRQFQKAFEERFAKGFYLRKTFLKSRYQLYDWVNFGLFHEGYFGQVVEGREGVLFEKYFLRFHADARSFCPDKKDMAVKVLKRISQVCKCLDVDFCVMFAPDKVQLCRSFLPAWSSLARVDKRMGIQREYEKILSAAGIPYFPALDCLMKYQPLKLQKDNLLFPVAGTHWNARAANLVVRDFVETLNVAGGRVKYRKRDLSGVKPVEVPRYCDTDIGVLLNLFDTSRVRNNLNFVPVFQQPQIVPNIGSVLVLGDSYTAQFAEALKDTGVFDANSVIKCDKRIPRADEFNRMDRDLRMFVFVLMPVNAFEMFTTGNWISQLSVVADRLEEKARKRLRMKVGTTRCCELKDKTIFYAGFSPAERGHIWTSADSVALRLPVGECSPQDRIAIEMSAWPYLAGGQIPGQRVRICVGDKVLKELVLSKHSQWTVAVSGRDVIGDSVEVLIDLPDAVSPKTAEGKSDTRNLAVAFDRLTVKKIDREL